MTQWYRFTRYYCRSCGEECINDHRDSCTRYRECRACHRVPDASREIVDHLLPSLRFAAHFVTEATLSSQGRDPSLGLAPKHGSPAASPERSEGERVVVRSTGGPDE